MKLKQQFHPKEVQPLWNGDLISDIFVQMDAWRYCNAIKNTWNFVKRGKVCISRTSKKRLKQIFINIGGIILTYIFVNKTMLMMEVKIGVTVNHKSGQQKN
jgi:hypothetical protein